MPDPHDTLSIFAEVSAALVGFSGIAIVFLRRTDEHLSTLEKRRLGNLFSLAGLALMLSLVGLSLLHVDTLAAETLWRGASVAVIVFATPWLIWDLVKVYRLDEAQRADVNPVLLYTFDSAAAVILVLLIANLLSIAAAWPVFLALSLIVGGAFQQFILLVRSGFSE